MRPFVVICLAASAFCAVTSCDTRPPPKFRVGDRVRVKVTREEGTVSLWTRFFREDHYLVRFPGSDDVLNPVPRPDLNFDAAWVAAYGLAVFQLPPKDETKFSHDEGIFYDTDLERVR